MKTEQFIRKPFYVEGIQVTPENMSEVAKWCGGIIKEAPGTGTRVASKYIEVAVIRPTNPKQCMAFVGNWILKVGVSFKVYTNSSFHSTFDRVN